MITAAALCPAPPLLVRELTGAARVVIDLWRSCADAAAGLAAARPDLVAVVGWWRTRRGAGLRKSRLDVSGYAPALRQDGAARAGAAASLPLPLGLGGRLLDTAGYAGPRVLQAVGADEPAGQCAELGAGLAGAAARVGLLVMADGSARRGLKAPGYLDERSAGLTPGCRTRCAAATWARCFPSTRAWRAS